MKKVVPFTKTITFKTMIAEITDIEVTHTLSLKDDYEIEGDILVDGTYKMTEASQIEEEFHYKLPFMIDIDSKYNLDELEITIGDFYFEIINEENLKINVEIDMDGIEEKKEEIVKTVTKLSFDNQEEPEVLEEKENNQEKEPEILDIEESNQEEEVLVRNDEQDENNTIPIPIEIEETTQKLELQSENINPLEKLSTQIEEDIKNDINTSKITQNQILYQNKTIQKPEDIDLSNITATNDSLSDISTASKVSSIFSSLTSSEETFSTYYVYIVRDTDTVESIIDKYNTTREALQNYNDLTDVKVGSKLIIPCTNNE